MRGRAGATPKTFWAAEGPKSGVAPARFGDFSAAGFAPGFRFKFLIAQCVFSGRGAEAGEDGGAEGDFCGLHCLSSAFTPLLPAAFQISTSNSTRRHLPSGGNSSRIWSSVVLPPFHPR